MAWYNPATWSIVTGGIDLDAEAPLRYETEGSEGPQKGRLVFRFDATRAIDAARHATDAAVNAAT